MPDGISNVGAQGKQVAVLAPPPLAGSGGHRTIYRNLNALAEAGFRVEVYVEGRRLRPGWLDMARTRRWFGVSDDIGLTPGWPRELDEADLVMATTWQSALHLGSIKTPGIKAHFVQDYECLFYPKDDERYALARSVHDLGFPSITIGSWLAEMLSCEHGLPTWPTPFSADLELYGEDLPPSTSRQRMVVANYQPEKPRRCPELMESALQLILDEDPAVEVVTFGSKRPPRLSGNHRHLGLVEPKMLATLYHEAGVGLSMSATNPSRVPFEMMAAGLPVIELRRDNTLLDLPASCWMAEPEATAVARAVQEILGNPEIAGPLGQGGRAFMIESPEALEVGAFVEASSELIDSTFPPLRPSR